MCHLCAEPLGSVKERAALSMIEELERQRTITPGKSTLLEITSGNTGWAAALHECYTNAKTRHEWLSLL